MRGMPSGHIAIAGTGGTRLDRRAAKIVRSAILVAARRCRPSWRGLADEIGWEPGKVRRAVRTLGIEDDVAAVLHNRR